MKKTFTLIMIVVLVLSSCSFAAFAGEKRENFFIEYDGNAVKYDSRLVTLNINGVEVKTGDMPAIIINSRTLVPVREVFESEAFGANVDWNGDKKEVYISYLDKLIILQIDSNIAYVNGEEFEMDVPPKLIRDTSKKYAKTMIPLRFVSENLDFDVTWDPDTYTAILVNEDVKKKVEADKDGNNVLSTEGEKLDSISGGEASKGLPTPLANNPVVFKSDFVSDDNITKDTYEVNITDESHSETRVKSVKYIKEEDFVGFEIKTSSEISSIDYDTWDSKYIIDINNSVNELRPEMTFEDNGIVTGVRASQFSISPNVTRVVFDLISDGYNFELSLNEDRNKIRLKVKENIISKIELGQDAESDYINISGITPPDVNVFRLSAPDRIVLDFPNTTSMLSYKEGEADGQYVKVIRTSQFDETTTRIVVETDGQPDYKIMKEENGKTKIRFFEPGYLNIEYDNTKTPTVKITEAEKNIDVDNISYVNNYMQRNFKITLSGNYSDMFGEGSLKVNDGIIEEVSIDKDNNDNTIINISSRTVYEYRIEKEGDKIYVKAYKPKELYDQVIVVDAGHGGKDPGASDNGLIEKELNLIITKKLKAKLDQTNIAVYYTRLDDGYPTLQERCDIANEVEADFFLSVHNNALNKSIHGTETLYFPQEDEDGFTSRKLARVFQNNLIDTLGSYNRGLKKRPDLFVLKHTTMPAIITEIGFVTNDEESAKLKTDSYLEKAAQALYEGILETLDTY